MIGRTRAIGVAVEGLGRPAATFTAVGQGARMFGRRIDYDRKRLLERADALAGGWRWRRSLSLYRLVLAAEPGCVDVHARVAPLLARSGRSAEAWASFSVALSECGRREDEARRRSLTEQALAALPTHVPAIRAAAKGALRSGDRSGALERLVRGSDGVARAGRRGEAILLLRDALEIERWRPAIVLRLARLLAKDGQTAEALYLLDRLEERLEASADGEEGLRAVRRLAWWIEPSVRHTWRWLRTPRPSAPGGRVGARVAGRVRAGARSRSAA